MAASCCWRWRTVGWGSRRGWLVAFPIDATPLRITHRLANMVRARILAIACGYEDADDLDALRVDPAFKLACRRLPDTDANLCSQPTLLRLENAPSLKDAIGLTWALVDQWMASYERSPRLSFSISTTPATSCTGISSFRSSTPITTSAASCRSMSTTPSARVPSRSCCAPARPRRVSRCAPICAGSCAISANAGPERASPFEAAATMPGPRRWNGARPTHRLRLRAARFEAAVEDNR